MSSSVTEARKNLHRQSARIYKSLVKIYWNHHTGTSHRLETNAVADRAVRRVKEGTAPAPVQRGLPPEWWDFAIICYLLSLVQVADGKTAFEKRYGDTFDGPSIPFDWVHPKYREGQVMNPSVWTKNAESKILRPRAVCLRRLVRWFDDGRLWRFSRSRRNLRQKIQKLQGVFVRHKCWISVCKWNSKTS